MFVQISPNEADVSETLCSLNFASRVRGVELGPARKHLDSSELFKYKQLVRDSPKCGTHSQGLPFLYYLLQ
jgi:kinesin family protein C2/C3